jgi:hypothetical protein
VGHKNFRKFLTRSAEERLPFLDGRDLIRLDVPVNSSPVGERLESVPQHGVSLGSVGNGLYAPGNLSGSRVCSQCALRTAQCAIVDRFALLPAHRSARRQPSSSRSTSASFERGRTLRVVQWAEGSSGQCHRNP